MGGTLSLSLKMSMLALVFCSLAALSACTSITHEVETRNGQTGVGTTPFAKVDYYVLTTTLHDFWNGSVEFVSLCKDVHIEDMHGNGVQDKTYFNCSPIHTFK
jgi:hypothetical protein